MFGVNPVDADKHFVYENLADALNGCRAKPGQTSLRLRTRPLRSLLSHRDDLTPLPRLQHCKHRDPFVKAHTAGDLRRCGSRSDGKDIAVTN